MNRYEEIAAMIVDEGVPVLLKGRGEITVLKLKYCPACGSFIKLHYGGGLRYFAVTWRCANARCDLASHWRPLHGWNEYYPPNIHTLLIETLKEILWKKVLESPGWPEMG